MSFRGDTALRDGVTKGGIAPFEVSFAFIRSTARRIAMRIVVGIATLALLAGCDGTAENTATGDVATYVNETAAVVENVNAPAPPPPPFLPSRVAGSPDPPGGPFALRGGIARPLSGEEGEGAAASRLSSIKDLTGRWGHNCEAGPGSLVFQPGLRFIAPGGSGRFQLDERSFDIVFTFEDGETETWTYGLQPGWLHLERRPRGGGKINRRLCSETP